MTSRRLPPHLVPLVAAPALGVLALAEARLDATFRPDSGALTLVAVWMSLALLLALRWPAVAVPAVAVFYPLGVLVGAPGPGGTGLIALLLAAGWSGYRSLPWRSLTAVTTGIAVFLVTDGYRNGIGWDTIFFPAILFPARWSGLLVRREQQRSRELEELTAELEAQREAVAIAAVQEERTRIAREVHDAVAHSVSVMTLQVGGLRRQLESTLVDRPAEREVMLGIERLGRESVEELRSLVGILRSSSEEPIAVVPSLARVHDLVADVAATGLPVACDVHGDPVELPRAVDAAAYRILQESLTNVLRHAPGSTTRVSISYANDAIDLSVEDDGNGAPAAPQRRGGARGQSGRIVLGGHGLVGMRERAEMFGGSLEAGPRQPRGFRVHARLPLGRRWA